MILIKSSVEVLDPLNGKEVLKRIEKVARTCYKSENKIEENSANKLVGALVRSGHEAMLEFVDITVKFTCSRAISHELVRHRVASFAQESQRYVNYSKDKYDNQITYIIPSWSKIPDGYTTENSDAKEIEQMNDVDKLFLNSLGKAEDAYMSLLKLGLKAQEARDVLPNATKTEINMKCNLREWRHFFKLRCDQAAHPEMRLLACSLLKNFHDNIPVIFDDLYDEFIDKRK